ncbi:S8 family peptidase [Brevibacillus sp. B_LB10_24]|uniref:S8 family peptidase n=1 Tax=Brevibacillus sp. B_LB10_24 TaxID=3380645 RepID=UPI0038B73094
MHKIITFPTQKGYHRCLSCLMKDESSRARAKILASLNTLIIPTEQYEKFRKLLGNEKHHVSDEVTVRLHATDEIPWGVEQVGAPEFWERTRGEGIKVAVIDTGISSGHPDLRGQVKGRVNIVNGGIAGHGTHVAGTIAAAANNRGIVGIAPAAHLYDVHVFSPDGTARMSDIIRGINWAVERRMDVINMSFGASQPNQALYHAIKKASQAGIVLVASAGNNGGRLEYPAAYKEVIAVGAVDRQNKIASFSSRGPGLVLAPGVQIKSTWLNNSYKVLDGTSMAAAHMSGLTALRIASRGSRSLQSRSKRRGRKFESI